MSSVCAPGTRSQGEPTHQLGKSRQWTSCETQKWKTKAGRGVLSSCASCSGGEQSASHYMERDKLMGLRLWSKCERRRCRRLRCFHFDFDISGKKVWKESAGSSVAWISDIRESDCSLKYWSCPHLTSSYFILFPIKVHNNILIILLSYLFDIHKFKLNLKNASGIRHQGDQIFIQKEFKMLLSYFWYVLMVWLVKLW